MKFQTGMAASLEHINAASIEKAWDNLKGAVTQTCVTELGQLNRHNEDWFDENDDGIQGRMAEKWLSFKA